MKDPRDDYRRWREADESGREEDADRAFGALVQTIAIGDRDQPISADFEARTLAAVAAAAVHDARRARRTRIAAVTGTIAAGIAAAYFGTGWAVSFLASVLIGAVNLIVSVIVKGATGLEAGGGMWALVASLARAVGAFVADPKVTLVLLAVQGIAMAALVALHRLLGSDVESFE